jgi:hypothetical protein
MNAEQLAVDFIPIIIFYVFLAYTRDAILFSNTILGKCIAVAIIAFYTHINSIYGLFVCMLILVYYQTDFVEEILNMEQSDVIEQRLIEMNREILQNFGEPIHGRTDSETTIAKNVAFVRPKPLPLTDEKNDSVSSYLSGVFGLLEGFQSNDPDRYAYRRPTETTTGYVGRVPDQPDKKAELMAIFRKENCVNGVLQDRGVNVRPEMAEHVFRELKYDNEFVRCNPCDPACSFSIIEERLNTEAKMKTPVNSNDFFQSNIEQMQTAFHQTTNEISGFLSGIHYASA